MTNYQNGFIVREPKQKGRFYIDNKFVDDEYIKVLGKYATVYTVLARHANNTTQACFPSYETIMREAGITRKNTIAEAIRVLRYCGLIGVKSSRGRKSNTYYLWDRSRWKSANSIAGATVRTVAKMTNKQYRNRCRNSISSDTGNELKKSTKEMGEENPLNIKKMSNDIADKMSIRNKFE